MKTNLSSQIKLDRIPKKYYAPESEIESAALCREEKVYTQILETSEEGARYIANEVAETINKTVTKKGSCVITLGAGMPMKRNKSIINISFGYTNRRTAPTRLVSENEFKISLGLTFNEMWFYKSRLH